MSDYESQRAYPDHDEPTDPQGLTIGASATFTSGGLTKALSVLIIGAVLLVAWRVGGPSSALAWNNDLDAARAQAANTNKPILIYFTADWCPPCQEMKKSTFSDGGVQQALGEQWVLVKVDLTERGGPNSQLAASLGVGGIPCFMVFRPDGEQVDSRTGFMPASTFLSWLQTCRQKSE